MNAALDYYLEAFDSDFVNFRRRNIRKNKVQIHPSTDPLAVLTTTRPVLKSPEHHLKGVNKPNQTGWNDVLLKSGFVALDKPIDKWTRIDLRRYVAHIYNARWGGTLLIGGEAQNSYSLINEIITKVEHCFRTEIKQDGNQILKDYFDFFVETQVPSAALEHGGMSWRKFSYQKYILAFTRHWKSTQEIIPIAPVVEHISQVVTDLSREDLTTAYQTSPHVFVREFGLLLTINYLLIVRKQTLEKALAYVKNAVSNLVVDEVSDVIKSTERYSPYPKWLVYVDVDRIIEECKLTKIVVSFTEDNPVLGFLKDVG